MADYTQNTPKYRAIFWDGTNEEEMLSFVTTYLRPPIGPIQQSVSSEGAFELDWGMGWVNYVVPVNTWVVTGAFWGDNPVPGRPEETMTSDEFALRFTEIV